MTKLFQNPDGAGCQARAVLAYLSGHDGIEDSWSSEFKCFLAEPTVDRWHNCREQGYVVSMRAENFGKQINIAFFEHRNSDAICAIEWEQTTMNPPTIDSMDTGGTVYKDKWDTSHSTEWGEAMQMADWIFGRLQAFWNANRKSIAA